MGDQLRPGDGVDGPDRAFSFKNAVKELAYRGALATFMSKPFADGAGCGAHNHIGLSTATTRENALSDAGARRSLGRRPEFVAGQLRHARSTYALLAPTVNCLKRRRTHTFSPTNVSWGIEDRSALIRDQGWLARVAPRREPGAEGLSNPYLVAAAARHRACSGSGTNSSSNRRRGRPAEEDPSKEPLPRRAESLDSLAADEQWSTCSATSSSGLHGV